jgi:WD40 repeat protein
MLAAACGVPGTDPYRPGQIALYNTKSGALLKTIQHKFQPPLKVAFHPKGTALASYHHDFFGRGGFAGIKVWDPKDGKELLSLPGATLPLTFLPDGKHLAVGIPRDEDRQTEAKVRLMDLASGQESGSYPLKGGMNFSSNGRWLAAIQRAEANNQGVIRVEVSLRDAASGAELQQFMVPGRTPAGFVFSPDGQWLVLYRGQLFTNLHRQNHVTVWNRTTGTEAYSLTSHTDNVVAAAFHPDGQRLATASRDGTVKLWDLATGVEVLTLTGHSSELFDVVFDPLGRRLISSDRQGTLRLWDIAPNSASR